VHASAETSAPAVEAYAANTHSGQPVVSPRRFRSGLPSSRVLEPEDVAATGTAATGPCDVAFDDVSTSTSR